MTRRLVRSSGLKFRGICIKGSPVRLCPKTRKLVGLAPSRIRAEKSFPRPLILHWWPTVKPSLVSIGLSSSIKTNLSSPASATWYSRVIVAHLRGVVGRSFVREWAYAWQSSLTQNMRDHRIWWSSLIYEQEDVQVLNISRFQTNRTTVLVNSHAMISSCNPDIYELEIKRHELTLTQRMNQL